MLQKIGKLLGGDPHKREIERLSGIADEVNQLEESFEKLSDSELRAKTEEFRRRLNDGETLDDILPEAFATVRAASKRTIGLRQYDVQVIGGIAIHQGKIVEMRTGEGKTLVATMPIYLNALAGKGVHLITVNDYLARRDARWMAPIYDFLGLSVSVLQMASKTENGQKAFLVDLNKESSIEDQHQLRMVHRREAYAADITYGTNNEFGFDYLRDNLTMRLEHRVQRGHNFAIIDEVDNVLIDEARTPLIISGPASSETELYERMAQIVRQLQPEDYEINERDRNVVLTEAGEAHVEELLETPLRDPDRPEDITPEQARLLGHLEQAMRAQYLYRRNKEYLVQGGKVVIVDEFTGRLMPGRRWSEGLHQAVEAKEGVKIEPENVTYATITLQNYFRMYEKLAGMTGTALTEAEEFDKIYSLEVLQLPTNLEFTAAKEGSGLDEIQGKDESGYRYTCYVRSDDPEKYPLYWKRKDYPDVVYRTEEGKFRAIVQEIMRYHILGRPILVGTTSVENSERLSIRLNTDFVRRLAQILIIRQAYIEQNNIDFIERAIPELELLNKPIDQLQSAELRNLTRSLNISLNPEDAENMRLLQKILDLQDEDQPRLTKTLQGGIQHQVLNARKHDEESQIIAKAGSFGAVTIATNMAGRGVDIKLGGELPEETQADVVRVMAKNGFEGLYNMKNEKRRDVLKNMDAEQFGIYEDSINSFLQIMEDNERVRKLGGLHVIGSERHEARRIDNQLRGRAARQGDPGSSRFYLSLEDELMRIFGGQQAEGLFKRLNVDENLPIEHNILGRLVEQSQERVEGSHFDVRKHLLEYDDVLNTQRERIYSQRDRVFTKEDLSEDVLDMLTVELQDRIPQSLKNDEGPWKLLAFLEEIQPPIHYDSNHYPSYTQHLLLSEIKHSMTGSGQPKEGLQHALLELSRNALEEERNHLTIATRSLIERTEESFLTQLEERLDLVDTFFSSMDEVDEDDPTMQAPKPQDIYAQLSETVRIPLKLSQNQIRSLADQDGEVIEEIKKQIEDYLTNIIINRLSMSIERRLQENLDVKPSQLQGMGWGDASRALFEAMENSLDQKIERLLADQGPLMRDINTEVQKIDDGEIADHQITEMLSILSRGTRTTFDRRTHRQKKVLYTRLSYTYLCAKLMEGQPPEEATEDILDHLEGAIESLKMAWGEMEWNRLLQNEIKLNRLDERIKNQFIDAYGEDFTQLGETSLMEFSEEERQIACDIIGKRLQNEVYRQLLLSVISEQWVEYLTRVEALRISIGMEAYAQRDPLVMYKSQATDMFKTLLADIRMAVVSRMFTYRPKRASEVKVEQQDTPDTAQAGSEPAQQQEQKEEGDQTTKKSSKSRRRRRR